MVECINCSAEHDSDSEDIRYNSNDNPICVECSIICESCDSVISTDEAIATGYHWYCNECAFNCERCDSGEHRDNMRIVGDESWCEGCADNHSFFCDICNDSYSDGYDHWGMANGNTLCDSCFDDNAYWCEYCEEGYYDDDPCECRSDDNPSGERCGNCGSRSAIHQYSCKLEPKFIGENKHGLFMGFELEAEIHGDNQEASKYAYRLQELGVAYLKQDSSISRNGYDGFEIVTQPHTLAQYQDKSAELWQTIDTLRTDYEARSWDTTTCGLHIHISRKGFSSGAHTHRFMSFIYHNADTMIKFAGRKSDFARFNDVWAFDEYDRPYFTLKHKLDPNFRSERYTAVNTNNRDTLELRFFRGTMRPSGVLSALELTQAIAEYTRDLRLDDIKAGALRWEWFSDYVRDNNGLYPNLYDRLPKLNEVDINKLAVLNA